MRAKVIGNAIEIVISRGDVALLALSALMLAMVFVLGGWHVAITALGLSVAGAGVIGAVQRLDAQAPG
jgi:hypothetical protein